MAKKKYELFLFTVVHFLIDLSCIYFLTGMLIPRFAVREDWLLLAVYYNMLAFALPMLIGLWADCKDRNNEMAIAGCLGVALAYLLHSRVFLAVTFLGLGNGIYHIGAGRQVLLQWKEQYAPCGIFISSGALGVYLGSLWGGRHYYLPRVLLLLMLAAAFFIGIMRRKDTDMPREKSLPGGISDSCPFLPGVGALLFVVIIRSYYGMVVNYPWKQGVALGLAFALSIAAGKFMGGILADRFGVEKVAALSLGTATILVFPASASPLAGCLSIALFNMTMPLTLSRMYKALPNSPGFAFGLLMFGLFLGTLPTMVWEKNWLSSPAGLSGLCLISMAVLLWEIRQGKKEASCSG